MSIITRSVSSPGRLSKRADTDEAITETSSDAPIARPKRGMTYRLPFGSGIIIPGAYRVPTNVLREIFTVLDQRDSPKKPGKVLFTTMCDAIRRFFKMFGEPYDDEHMQSAMDKAIEELERQIEKWREGHTHYRLNEDPMVYWDQEVLFTCFQVSLPRSERLFFTFDMSENSTWASQSISCLIMVAVVVSILTFVLGTLPGPSPDTPPVFAAALPYIDVVCVCIFTLDYLVRLLTVANARMELLDRSFLDDLLTGRRARTLMSPRQRLCQFLASPMGLVDLFSVVPFWVELALEGLAGLEQESGSEVLRVLRLVRIVRVFKLGKAAKADLGNDRNMVLHLFVEVVDKGKVALQLVALLILLALLLFGSLIWYAERGVYFAKGDPRCPEASLCADAAIRIRRLADGSYESGASPFVSIPLSFWWVLVTITTVGYGDYYPVTPLGYCVGGATILYGVVVFALPVGIIGTAFSQAYDTFLSEQAFRRRLAQPSAPDGVSLDDVTASDSLVTAADSSEPVVITELKRALHQASMAAGLSVGIHKKWEADFLEIARFEKILREHPCDSLEMWGGPVLATLKEHAVVSDPIALKCLGRLRAAWYSLLLQALQAYDQFQASLPVDRRVFDAALRAKEGEVPSARIDKLMSIRTTEILNAVAPAATDPVWKSAPVAAVKKRGGSTATNWRPPGEERKADADQLSKSMDEAKASL